MAVLGSVPASGADEWVRVATDGLGDGSRPQVDAIAVYRDYVYIAVHQSATLGSVSILRAWLRDDHIWSDITPPWGAAGEVSALEVVGGVLYAATTDGKLWSRGTSSRWSWVSRPWVGNPEIFHVGEWDPEDGLGIRLCVFRVGPAIACRTSVGAWTELRVVPLVSPLLAQTGRLKGFDRELYISVSRAVAGTSGCEVWRYGAASGWRSITTDCFGGAAGGLSWLTDMEVYAGKIYFGTGGHTTGDTSTLIMRSVGGVVEDVTPRDLYTCSDFFGACPSRYNALAATSASLFVGTRTATVGNLADVLSSADGEEWAFSNVRGFGEEFNDTVTAMGSRSVYVYAGVYNGLDGFQVWRRSFPVVELIPPLYRDLWEARHAGIIVLRCLLPFNPCAPPWEELFWPIEEIRLGLELANYSQDDPVPIKVARAGMTRAREMLDDAYELAMLAEQAGSPKEARAFRLKAARLVLSGLVLGEKTVRTLGKGGWQ